MIWKNAIKHSAILNCLKLIPFLLIKTDDNVYRKAQIIIHIINFVSSIIYGFYINSIYTSIALFFVNIPIAIVSFLILMAAGQTGDGFNETRRRINVCLILITIPLIIFSIIFRYV